MKKWWIILSLIAIWHANLGAGVPNRKKRGAALPDDAAGAFGFGFPGESAHGLDGLDGISGDVGNFHVAFKPHLYTDDSR